MLGKWVDAFFMGNRRIAGYVVEVNDKGHTVQDHKTGKLTTIKTGAYNGIFQITIRDR